ncbi:hypothetical protein [Flavobacterium sp. H4147]|uniref:hypothetical protein n=1 Tax=Flavobacterium sp. H4147 TaxID=3034149 RepID=UPI0023EB5C38|nr:hypothetical protein [Flavobacterium sp. H4147]
MVKKSITNKLICLFVMFSLLQSNVLFAGRCSGSSNCGACSSCNYCGYCNSGGSCGVCGGDSSSGFGKFLFIGFLIFIGIGIFSDNNKKK